jgi:hypothetical protein
MYIQVTTPTGSTWVPAVTTVAGSTFGATFKYTETSAATTWSIQHNLNTLTPIVQVYTGSQVIVPSTIRSVDANSSEITFAQATLGAAILSTGVGGPTSASFAASANVAQTASFLSTPTINVIENNSAQFFNNSSTIYSTSTRLDLSATTQTFNEGLFTVGATGITPAEGGIYEIVFNGDFVDAGSNPTRITAFIGVNGVSVLQRSITISTSAFTALDLRTVVRVQGNQLIDFRFGSTGAERVDHENFSIFLRKIGS